LKILWHQAQGLCLYYRRLDGALRKLGEDVAEVLELVPGFFKVIRHVREKHACRGCSRIVQPAAPSEVIGSGVGVIRNGLHPSMG
jgi:transposase